MPDNQNTYVFSTVPWKLDEETFEAHDGGYVYGATAQPKDFTLRCIYENNHINDGELTRIMHFFKRGRTGKLIFQTRPWCWYVATVASVDATQMTNYLNGFITIKMRAYYPFARTEQTYIYNDDPNETNLLNNTAMMKGVEWDLSKNFASSEITEQTTYQLYNPGTETAAVSIEIAGDVGTGVTITNSTTGQSCKIVALTKAITTDASKYLIIDSLSGKVLLTTGSATEYGFLYHDNGFIDLASNYPVIRNANVTGAYNTNKLNSSTAFDESIIGQYFSMRVSGSSAELGSAVVGQMLLNNAAASDLFIAKITGLENNNKRLVLDRTLPVGVTVAVNPAIGTFNNITVTPATIMALTKLIFRYKPTFA